MSALKQERIGIPHYCRRCKEMLADGQMVCPFCDRDAVPVDELPAWFRQPGEPFADYERRRLAENAAGFERRAAEFKMPLKPLRCGLLGLATGVGTYDANGNPKGSGWW